MKKLLLLILIAGFFVVNVKPVHADPHAVFYTTIGQQQLFFNMLAALDQADYVEPAVNTTGTDTGSSREELLQRRSQTDYEAPPTNLSITSTKTDLASVLTRNITLEGNDLWTAYQLQGRSNDFQRRTGLSKVVRQFCQFALGLPLCDITIGDSPAAKNERYSAITLDPVKEQTSEPLERGAYAVLTSGTEIDRQIRQDIVDHAKNPVPYEYNPFIAQAWGNVLGNQNKENYFDELAGNTLVSLVTPQIDPSYYGRIDVDENGVATSRLALASSLGPGTVLAQEEDECSGPKSGLAYTTCFLKDLTDPLYNMAALRDAAIAGQENIQKEQTTNEDGYKAEKFSDPQPGVAADGTRTIGRIGTTVRSPAHARSAATDAIYQGGIDGDLSIESAPSQGQYTPGDQPLINKPFAGEDSPGNPAVEGAQDTITSDSGRVLQATDDGSPTDIGDIIDNDETAQQILDLVGITEEYYSNPQNPVGVEQNIRPVHTERGILDALTAYDNAFSSLDTERGGFAPGIGGIWDDFCNVSDIC